MKRRSREEKRREEKNGDGLEYAFTTDEGRTDGLQDLSLFLTFIDDELIRQR